MATLRAFTTMQAFFLILLTSSILVSHLRRGLPHVCVLKLFACALAIGRLQLSTAKATHECALEFTEALLVTSCIIISFSLIKLCFFIVAATFLYYLNWILLVNFEPLESFGRRACELSELSSTFRRDASCEISSPKTKAPALDLIGTIFDRSLVFSAFKIFGLLGSL